MKIFATYNIKGGVGKTTAAVNLAYLSAADGHRTLLWDLDPQGAASFLLRVKPRVKGGGKALIRGTKALDKFAIADKLENVGAEISFTVGTQSLAIRAKPHCPPSGAKRLKQSEPASARSKKLRVMSLDQ